MGVGGATGWIDRGGLSSCCLTAQHAALESAFFRSGASELTGHFRGTAARPPAIRSSLSNMAIPRSTYYDKHWRQSPALVRARQPYLIKNVLTGAAIFGFAIGVYAFTIRAVAQDDFEDVKVPEKPAQPKSA